MKLIQKIYSLIQRKLGIVVLNIAGLYFTIFHKYFKTDGLVYYIPPALTNYKFRGLFATNIYEKEERKYLKKYLDPESKVLELGACLGVVSCLTNRLLKDPNNHVVLEANPNLIKWIEKNKLLNNSKFNIENSIISNKEKNDFYISDIIVISSKKLITNNKVEINGITIPQLENKYGITFNTLIMDIEGGELDFLQENRLSINKFNTIFMEIHPFNNILTIEEANECENILVSQSFRIILQDGYFQVWKKT